ncbi:MAG: glycogen debranching enzyme [Acidobacteriaceae bacterium]|nr:glycogen debranching enzyme [Acidobacteriaceae bacterium]
MSSHCSNEVPERLIREHHMPFGCELQEPSGVSFRIFAPGADTMRLKLGGASAPLQMNSRGDGWHQLSVPDAGPGTSYFLVLPDGTRVPDPASRYQPDDVYGPSEVIDPKAYAWRDRAWRGRSWTDAVLYEMHVGAFTPEGKYRSVIEKLEHLQELGITAIELMAVGDFPGRRNWGYDGVLWYAPDSSYGRPEELKGLVDAAHARGIMVIFDVVYNHLGYVANFIPRYWPEFHSSLHDTPWGKPPNFDGHGKEQVREFIIHNALYWIEEFHGDGLRLDASHDMKDCSPRHILDELAERVHTLAGERQVHLILEDEHNESARMMRDSDGRARLYSAQWNHQMAHLRELPGAEPCSLRAAVDQKTEIVSRMLAIGFGGITKATNEADEIDCHAPPAAYVSFLQTHDLVGNDLLGQRIYAKAPVHAVRALSAIYLLVPQIPMLFMGDEWGASTPFPFFCDFDGDTGQQAREGRLKFLRKNLQVEEREFVRVPDPLAELSFRSAHLDWNELSQRGHAEWLRWYRDVLKLRREQIVPLAKSIREQCGTYELRSRRVFAATWNLEHNARLILQANLCEIPAHFDSDAGRVLWIEGTEMGPGQLGPWTVRWSVESFGDPHR